ncbi:ABC transporter ATP-binding protein [candidate division KSB1 bacterium]|nr:ABC transporter ATP-binding protein [candidate division KSB1 bacterium]
MNNHSTQTVTREAVVEVRNVYKSFKTVKAVQGVNLLIYSGQFLALLGPNGAGKTTLVEMIEGIQTPDSGDIVIMGKHWKGHADELHRLIGLSLQETRFIDKLNVRETLKLFASFYDLNHQRVEEIIDMVGLKDKCTAYVVNLSGGQRQRLALGIALLNNPKILLLDEPTTGLDPNARREVWSILFKLKEQSETSLILTTHYMEEAEQLCDYIVIIDNGQILKEGTLDQLLNEDRAEKLIAFTLEDDQHISNLDYSEMPFPVQWDTFGKSGSVALNQIEADIPTFLSFLKQHNIGLKNFECRRKTLDDLFVSMTGRRLNG